MKKRTNTPHGAGQLPKLVLLIGGFILGAAAGSLLAANSETTASLLTEGLLGGQSTPALRMMLYDAGMLAMVFAAAFVRNGTPLCTLALFLKGLLLSLTVTSCVGAMGAPGWGVAFALVFGSGFLAVAAFLLLSLQALQPEGKRLRRGKNLPDNVYFLSTLLCAGIIGISELIYWFLSPPMARAAVVLFT